MADVALSSNTWSKLLPKIKQYEATTGRQISSEVLEGLVRADIDEAYDRSAENAQLGIQQEELELSKEAAKDAASAAKVSGAVQLGGTAVQAGILYKSLFPSTVPPATTATAAVNPANMSMSAAYADELSTATSPAWGTGGGTGAVTTSTELTLGGVAGATGVGAVAGTLGGLYASNRADKTDDPANIARRGRTTGAIAGAVAGAAYGSVVPGVGSVVGLVVGGIVGAFSGGK